MLVDPGSGRPVQSFPALVSRNSIRFTLDRARRVRRAAWGNGSAATPKPRPRPTQPVGAIVLSVDEKTQVQALDRTQPLLPIAFDATEKRTHDYVRHGTTNLFAALNVGTGEVLGECRPRRDGDTFLAFLKKAVTPHAGKEIHIVLDNLSTHTTPAVTAWLEKNPNIHFHFTPVGSSWINQIETWLGIITRQAIRRGTFSSVKVLIKRIRDYIAHWNRDAEPFVWIAKVRFVQSNIRKLLDNNAK